MNQQIEISDGFRRLAEKHFVLLHAENIKKERDTLQLRLSGYTDVANLIADITKVCILALGDGNSYSSAHIPSPESNISGVLAIILELIPYEEMNFLDSIRKEVLAPAQPSEEDWEFILATITLSQPSGII